ncbi:MAG TPA: hemolysin family protein [Dehalococcoidia bacterium]|nr:hemolysin family protein [Dehalococcoidia bacterium]
MNSETWPAVAVLVLAAALLLLVVLAEAGVVARFRARQPERRGSRLDALQQYARERQQTLAALALARNLAVVIIAAVAAFIAVDVSGHNWPALVIAAVLTLLGLVALQTLPRLLAIQDSEKWERRLQPLVWAVRAIFSWPARILDLPLTTLLRVAHLHHVYAEDADEILRLAELDESTGIPTEERAMIRSIMEMEHTTAREIMVPRIDIVAVEVNATFDELIRLIVDKGYSRIPVYEETIDNIVGVAHAKQVLRHIAGNGGKASSIRDIMRAVHFIPETKRVDELLRELRLQKVSIAIVVDEYGGTAGLVTLEDVVEEIVGEIADEFDIEEEPLQRISDDEVIVDGKCGIDELAEFFGIEIEKNDFDTVGGFIFNQLGKMPNIGDEIRFDGLALKVLSVLGRRIKKVRVLRQAVETTGGRAEQAS